MKLIYIFIVGLITELSCTKYVQIPPPPNQLISSTVFSSDGSATAALSGIYSDMMESPGYCLAQIPILCGLYADELTNYSTDSRQIEFFANSVNASNSTNGLIWTQFYNYIYGANAAVEGINASVNLTPAVRKQLLGEAKFIRALCYFYLLNFYGDLPLTISTDYKQNSILSRSAQSQVYAQIVADLKDAQTELVSDYSFSSGERVRPNTWAATALLARVYLYQKDWTDAVTQSSNVIGNSSLFALDSSLDDVFLSNSQESILQLEPVSPGYNTWDGYNFILVTSPSNVALTSIVMNAFDMNDKRKSSWTDSLVAQGQTYYYANKYKVKSGDNVTEYYTVLRLAEQYLIRAEANAELNNIAGAEADLNVVRNRAGLPNYSSQSQDSLLNAIMKERQTEFFCEWGNRWLDLKRTQQADPVLGNEKPGWNSTDTLFPILQTEILNDPNLTQNAGY